MLQGECDRFEDALQRLRAVAATVGDILARDSPPRSSAPTLPLRPGAASGGGLSVCTALPRSSDGKELDRGGLTSGAPDRDSPCSTASGGNRTVPQLTVDTDSAARQTRCEAAVASSGVLEPCAATAPPPGGLRQASAAACGPAQPSVPGEARAMAGGEPGAAECEAACNDAAEARGAVTEPCGGLALSPGASGDARAAPGAAHIAAGCEPACEGRSTGEGNAPCYDRRTLSHDERAAPAGAGVGAMEGGPRGYPGEKPWPAAALPRGVREEWEAGVLRYAASIKRSKKHKRAVQPGTFGTGVLQ